MVVKAKVDTKAFDAALRRYMEYSKKLPEDIVLNKAFFVARNAVRTTGAVTRDKVEQELRAQSNKYDAPLGAVLVNARQRGKGEKGLTGSAMTAAVNKLIKARKRSANFLRAGWIPAVKGLASKLGKGSPAKGVKTYGAPKGGTKTTGGFWKATTEIWNSVTSGKERAGINSKHSPERVADIVEDGLQKAIEQETTSMWNYIKKKQEQALEKLRTR